MDKLKMFEINDIKPMNIHQAWTQARQHGKRARMNYIRQAIADNPNTLLAYVSMECKRYERYKNGKLVRLQYVWW